MYKHAHIYTHIHTHTQTTIPGYSCSAFAFHTAPHNLLLTAPFVLLQQYPRSDCKHSACCFALLVIGHPRRNEKLIFPLVVVFSISFTFLTCLSQSSTSIKLTLLVRMLSFPPCPNSTLRSLSNKLSIHVNTS